ncbi:putative transposase [Vibrio nigripulchritudo]|uniref:Putative transposase n=1 Tax=Vibrio nigripulchritudo TaxID=28173 RepID=U4JZJ5_9VIBR|nr:helix-turn-helix domain-containing protein [Vibrio nigripulchritudo]CCO58415.1 putative transposase [Vibrio nigripulchritudo]
MSKYSRALKCSIAKQYLQGESSSQELSRLHSIPSRQIRYWAQVFDIHGSQAFTPHGFAKNAQTKLQALKHIWTNGWSISHTSAVLNFSSSGMLAVWLKQYERDGFQGLERSRGRPAMSKPPFIQNKSDDEKTLEELKEELAYLRAENAVLKKLEELEQEKHRRTKKKRKSF